MKVLAKSVLFLIATVFHAAEPGITNAPEAKPLEKSHGTVLGLARGNDPKTLLIRYKVSGLTNEQTVVLPTAIADWHFCSWVFDYGVALALSDTSGETFWAACYFDQLSKPIHPHRLRSPGGYKLMGIANTRGDTIVITGLKQRDDAVLASGWMYINGCPPASDLFSRPQTAPIQASGFDHLVFFDVPREQPSLKK